MSTEMTEIAKAKNGIGDAIVSFIDAIDIGAIYTMFLKPFLHQFLEDIGKYFLFPIAAGAGVVKAILSWRHAYLDKGDARSVVPAVVETLGALAIVAAVIGSMVASALFVLATPIIFTAVVGGKTLFQLGSTIYYAGKAAGTDNLEKKQEFNTRAKNSLINTIAGTIATVAVACVFLFGKLAIAAVGVAGAGVIACLAVYRGYKAYQESQKTTLITVNPPADNFSSSDARLIQSLGQTVTQPLLRETPDDFISQSSDTSVTNNDFEAASVSRATKDTDNGQTSSMKL